MARPRHAICTIIAKNYLAFARTLCQSFLEHHPGGVCYVLVVDEHRGHIAPGQEPFALVGAGDLGIPDFPSFAFRYNVTELSTAVKPSLLTYLLAREETGKVLFLDPDILVTGPLDGLYDALDTHDAIVTPHLDTDYPEDGLFPDDSHILRSGVYNLGFIGFRRSDNAARILDWWQGKVRRNCTVDHARGYFVDQRFLDLALGLFEGIGIIRHAGYNVAYWNLHSRKLQWSEGRWRCNDGPLFFFHFSNFRPEAPDVLSGFQNRHDLGKDEHLKRLFDSYRALVLTNGYLESRDWPYTYGCFLDGKPINETFRRLYRASRSEVRDPFDRSTLPLGLRLARPLTVMYDGVRRSLMWTVKRSSLLSELAQRVYGPFPRGF